MSIVFCGSFVKMIHFEGMGCEGHAIDYGIVFCTTTI